MTPLNCFVVMIFSWEPWKYGSPSLRRPVFFNEDTNWYISESKHLDLVIRSNPLGSMYSIFTYIYHKNQPNVGKYTRHGSYGNYLILVSFRCCLFQLNRLGSFPGEFFNKTWRRNTTSWMRYLGVSWVVLEWDGAADLPVLLEVFKFWKLRLDSSRMIEVIRILIWFD